jgi:hypothetical protein
MQRTGAFAVITLCNPSKRNAMSLDVLNHLSSAFQQASCRSPCALHALHCVTPPAATRGASSSPPRALSSPPATTSGKWRELLEKLRITCLQPAHRSCRPSLLHPSQWLPVCMRLQLPRVAS